VDSKPLSEQELQSIRERWQAASAEPLATIGLGQNAVALFYTRGRKAILLAKYYGKDKIANARFAAKARQDVESLLCEIDRLRTLTRTEVFAGSD
jgi:hypothetical protein